MLETTGRPRLAWENDPSLKCFLLILTLVLFQINGGRNQEMPSVPPSLSELPNDILTKLSVAHDSAASQRGCGGILDRGRLADGGDTCHGVPADGP